MHRAVFFISDRTGITAEMLGQSILSQFRSIKFQQFTMPFVDSVEKARAAAERINSAAEKMGVRPVVMSTLIDPEISQIIADSNALFLDCLGMFIAPLEQEFNTPSSHTVGLSHTGGNTVSYTNRIEAINFSLTHDDGLGISDLDLADVILVGVSRAGKTPTSLYMAMQFGLRAANYPLTPEDLQHTRLPEPLAHCRHKLFGLTIDPMRLHQIREERRSGSDYATLINCMTEIQKAEAIFKKNGIPVLDTTTKSIEELATLVMQEARLSRNIM